MSYKTRADADRRSGSLAEVSALVSSRSETLSLYSGLAAHRPFSANEAFEEELKHFCEALIDYTASAHFQLYQRIAESKERRKAMLDVANNVYPKIAETTDQILDFNDAYSDKSALTQDFNRVEEDLSSLGEVLADRIQFEDLVIEAMRSERRTPRDN